ncbi:hypothetical protein Q8F55_004090 [Vanrija albida]|uniref:Uncharacterized protein n=1 Tax=Vanrija albida TaxID=181172 RepID=A0ABR3Q6F2_9TREE
MLTRVLLTTAPRAARALAPRASRALSTTPLAAKKAPFDADKVSFTPQDPALRDAEFGGVTPGVTGAALAGAEAAAFDASSDGFVPSVSDPRGAAQAVAGATNVSAKDTSGIKPAAFDADKVSFTPEDAPLRDAEFGGVTPGVTGAALAGAEAESFEEEK